MSEKPDSAGDRRRAGFKISLGRLIDDFIVLSTGQFLAKVFGFLAFAWLARILTVADYGAVETAVGMAAIGAVAIELGTGSVGVRRIAQKEASPSAVLGAVISARLLLAVAIAPVLGLAYAVLTARSMPDALFWLFAASLLAFPFNHNWFFQSQEKMAAAGFGQTLKMGAFLLAIHFLAPESNGVLQVGVAEIIAVSAMAIWYSALAFRELRPQRPAYSLAGGVATLRESGPLGGSAVVNTASQYVPLVIVAALSTPAETAEFGASQRLIVSLITFSFVYYFNLYPLLARRFVDDADGLKEVVAASVRVTAWVGVFVAAMLWAAAPLIMRIVFGNEFAGAGPEFSVLAWGGALTLASGNARWLLVATHRQASLFWAQCAGAATIFVLCALLTPKMGGTGASIACALGAAVLWLVAHLRTRGLPVRAPLADNIPAAIVAVATIAALTIMNAGLVERAAAAFAAVAGGMVLDRRFRASVRVLARAKSGG